jgi:hypothetical protein
MLTVGVAKLGWCRLWQCQVNMSSVRPKSPVSQAPQPVQDAAVIDAILEAISSIDPDELRTASGGALDSLSTRTGVSGIEPVLEGIFRVGEGRFEALATVYVDLEYGPRDDGFVTSDSFPARVKGRYSKTGSRIVANVEDVEVDTSAFYQ